MKKRYSIVGDIQKVNSDILKAIFVEMGYLKYSKTIDDFLEFTNSDYDKICLTELNDSFLLKLNKTFDIEDIEDFAHQLKNKLETHNVKYIIEIEDESDVLVKSFRNWDINQ